MTDRERWAGRWSPGVEAEWRRRVERLPVSDMLAVDQDSISIDYNAGADPSDTDDEPRPSRLRRGASQRPSVDRNGGLAK